MLFAFVVCLCAHYINLTFTTSLQKTFLKKQTFRMDKKGWMYIRMDRTEEAFNAVIKLFTDTSAIVLR